MKKNSFVLLAMLGCMVLILGITRLINSTKMQGLSNQVICSVPIHLGIAGLNSLMQKYYS